jgi:hypothetical protein
LQVSPKQLPMLAVAALLALPATAGADTLSVDDTFDDEIAYTGEGVVDNVTVTWNRVDGADDTAVFSAPGDTITVAANDQDLCTGTGTAEVTCTRSSFFEIVMEMGGDNDVVSLGGTGGVEVDGESGDDQLTGSEQNGADEEFLGGGPGVDTLVGRGGDDELEGGPDPDLANGGAGQDEFFDQGGEGNDTYIGGPDIDGVFYDTDSVDPLESFALDLKAGTAVRSIDAPETDSLTEIEDGFTQDGNDSITGSDVPNELEGGDGNDTINPLGGGDLAEGEDGDDSFELRDGASDRVFCGPGVDTVQADQFDQFDNCENVTVSQMRPEGADLLAPACTVARVKRSYTRKAFSRGITPDVDCNEGATLEMRLLATVKGGTILARAGDLVLAERTTTAGTNVRLRPAKKVLGRFKKGRGFRVRLVVEARDQFGNRSTVTKRAKVKKAKRKRGRR